MLETFEIPKPAPTVPDSTVSIKTKRLTVQVYKKLGEKIQDYAYQTGLTQQQIIHQALVEFLAISDTLAEEIQSKKGLEYVAKKMLANGYTKEEIQKITDLTIHQIEHLSQSINL